MADVNVTTPSTGASPTTNVNVEDTTPNPNPSQGSPPTPQPDPASIKAEKEAAYWRGVAEARGGTMGAPKADPPAPPPPPQPPTEPKFEDFSTPADFENARTKYLGELADFKAKERVEAEIKSTTEQDRKKRAMEGFMRRVDEAAKTDPDIYQMRDRLGYRVGPVTASLIIESDHSPSLIRHFDENPGELSRINSLDPQHAAKEMGRIEAELISKAKSSSTTPNVVSNTPPPTPQVNAGGGAPAVEDPSDPESTSSMDAATWVMKRNQQLVERAKAAR